MPLRPKEFFCLFVFWLFFFFFFVCLLFFFAGPWKVHVQDIVKEWNIYAIVAMTLWRVVICIHCE